MSNFTTSQAAAEIVALMNATPRTPRPDQIEAIVARAVDHSGGHRTHALEGEWDALFEEWRATWQRVDDVDANGQPTPETETAEEAAQVVAGRLDALAVRIMATPEPTLEYARLMVRVSYFVLWSGDWYSSDRDSQLADGPAHHVEGLCAAALAALMAATWAINPMGARNV